jgi:type I restriction enzyme S subunit
MATTATIGEHALLIADSLANQQFTFFTQNVNRPDIKLNMKYAFYYFFIIGEWCKENVNVSSFPSVDMERLKKYRMPIPSLDEQERIVAILDQFEELTTNLTQGLPAEIAARKRQYEYYRDKLLAFKECA